MWASSESWHKVLTTHLALWTLEPHYVPVKSQLAIASTLAAIFHQSSPILTLARVVTLTGILTLTRFLTLARVVTLAANWHEFSHLLKLACLLPCYAVLWVAIKVDFKSHCHGFVSSRPQSQ